MRLRFDRLFYAKEKEERERDQAYKDDQNLPAESGSSRCFESQSLSATIR